MPDDRPPIIDLDSLINSSSTRENADNQSASNTASNYAPYQDQFSTGSQQAWNLMSNENRLNGPEIGGAQVLGTSVNDNVTSGLKNPRQDLDMMGRASFFNPYYLIRYHSASKTGGGEADPNQSRLDGQISDGTYIGLADDAGYKNASTSYILKYLSSSGENERRLSYADFLYLKNYHPYNNNRLIILRRFMLPVYDNLRIAYKKINAYDQLSVPIAKALTYFGEGTGNSLSTLTKFDYGINTKNVDGTMNTTNIQETDWTKGLTDATRGIFNTMGLSLDKIGGNAVGGAAALLSYLSDEGDTTGFGAWTSNYDPWSQGPLSDLVYGPVNVITKAKIRDRGLSYKKHNYVVTFEYSLKSIGGLNPKAALLDILGNMLALTYNHAMFWGGENRFLIDRQNFPLINQELFHKFLANPGSSGVNEVIKSLSTKTETAYQKIINSVSELISGIGNGEGLSDSQKKNIGDSATAFALSGNVQARSLAKQIFEGHKSILTGAPTGEWHLQVGNPLAPIMMVGNLWCTSANFEFSDELGVDDFPTELKVVVTLEDGRARDASDLQSIFNSGGGRIYYPYNSKESIDPNSSYSTQNSETAIDANPETVKGAWNRLTTDKEGTVLSELTLNPASRDGKSGPRVTKNGDGEYVQRSIFHRIKDHISK